MVWYIKIKGDPVDIYEVAKRFNAGPIHIMQEGDYTYLVGPGFEDLDDPRAVIERAHAFLLKANGIVSLEWPAVKLLDVGGVERRSNGSKTQYVAVKGMESRVALGEVKVGDATTNTPSDRTQRVLRAAGASPNLDAALSIWGRSNKTWGDLYRITEELEAHVGQGLPKAGLCSKNQLGRLTQSAQSHAVASLDARHHVGNTPEPASPMTLEEATEFVGSMLKTVVRSASEKQ